MQCVLCALLCLRSHSLSRFLLFVTLSDPFSFYLPYFRNMRLAYALHRHRKWFVRNISCETSFSSTMHLLKWSWGAIKTTKTTTSTFVSIRQWKENVQFIKLSFMKLYVYRWFIIFSHFLLPFRMWMYVWLWVFDCEREPYGRFRICVVEIWDFYLNGATSHSPQKLDAQKNRMAHQKGIKSITGMDSTRNVCALKYVPIVSHSFVVV